MPTNYSYTKNGITFNEIHKHGITSSSGPAIGLRHNYTVSGTNIDNQLAKTFNAIDIDWCGGYVSGVSGSLGNTSDFLNLLQSMLADVSGLEAAKNI